MNQLIPNFMNKSLKRVLVAVLVLSTTCAFAQQEVKGRENRDANNKIVRGPYLTNRFFDNIFIGVAGGVNVYHGENDSYGSFGKRLAPALDINVGKWFTPSVGARVGYSGINAKGWTTSQTLYAKDLFEKNVYNEKFGVSYLHADFMWNISNAISGYREDRTWNFVPFVGTGWARSYGNDAYNNEFAMSIGLLNNIRLCNVVDLTLEARHMFVSQNFDGVIRGSKGEGMTSVTVGLTFKLNRRNFKRAPKEVVPDYTPYIDRINTLENTLQDKEDQIKDLNDQLAAARKQKPAPVTKVESASMAIFFQIGKADLTDKEMINLGYMAEIIKKSPEKTFKVIGSADKSTGSAKRNQQLSEMRAEAVCNALVEKYGVNKKQLQVVANGSNNEPFDKPVLNRVTIVE